MNNAICSSCTKSWKNLLVDKNVKKIVDNTNFFLSESNLNVESLEVMLKYIDIEYCFVAAVKIAPNIKTWAPGVAFQRQNGTFQKCSMPKELLPFK